MPLPSRFSSPRPTSFLKEPSIELTLSVGHSSRISCFVNLPILFNVAFRTISTAGSFSSTIENLSSKSLYAARMVLSRYLMNGVASSVPSCHPSCIIPTADCAVNARDLACGGEWRRKKNYSDVCYNILEFIWVGTYRQSGHTLLQPCERVQQTELGSICHGHCGCWPGNRIYICIQSRMAGEYCFK